MAVSYSIIGAYLSTFASFILITRFILKSMDKICHAQNSNKSAGRGRVDVELAQQAEQVENYWRSVLKRLIGVIKFSCERGLTLRGENEIIGSYREYAICNRWWGWRLSDVDPTPSIDQSGFARKERNLHCDVHVTYPSPMKTNTYCRRLGRQTLSGWRDRSDPEMWLVERQEWWWCSVWRFTEAAHPKHANLGSGHTNYLSSTICEELVEGSTTHGKACIDEIVTRIKRSRYSYACMIPRQKGGTWIS